MTRLYITEGLPCSGKSTTARYISGLTGGRLYDENCGCHPADYEFSAFIPEDSGEFSGEELRQLEKGAEHVPGGIVVPLNTLSGELFDRALKFKLYDFLDWETEYPVMLHKWRSFAQSAGDGVNVFNCVLLQNPMCETMMRFNFPQERSLEYISAICREIQPLEPVVVYLKSARIRENILSALPERGEDWLNGVTDYHCGGGYGKAHGLSGFDGYISALEERQRRELEILKALPVKSLILDEPQQDWNAAYSTIRKYIEENA